MSALGGWLAQTCRSAAGPLPVTSATRPNIDHSPFLARSPTTAVRQVGWGSFQRADLGRKRTGSKQTAELAKRTSSLHFLQPQSTNSAEARSRAAKVVSSFAAAGATWRLESAPHRRCGQLDARPPRYERRRLPACGADRRPRSSSLSSAEPRPRPQTTLLGSSMQSVPGSVSI